MFAQFKSFTVFQIGHEKSFDEIIGIFLISSKNWSYNGHLTVVNLYRSLKSNSLDIFSPLFDRNLVEKHVGILDFYDVVLRW